MRSRPRVGLLLLVSALLACAPADAAAAPPARHALSPKEREAILMLIKAVDLAQEVDAPSADGLSWESHVLKSGDETAYVPFRLTLDEAAAGGLKSPAIYVRVVTRRDGFRVKEERSSMRDRLLHGSDVMARMPETIYVGVGEMPVGGLAAASTKQATAAAATASAAMALQQRAYEKQKRLDEAAQIKRETRQRDPLIFPFEDYYLVDLAARSADPRRIERALSMPPGEYDVFVALVDRAKVKTSSALILKQRLTVPDFWNDQLSLSSLILVSDVHPLKAALPAAQQAEHPYTLGQTEIVPVVAPSFSTGEALSVVYQMCNYGAPDSDLTAEYTFYRTDGARRIFNRTDPQQYADADLPPPGTWSTQAFAMQTVPLRPFPPGAYELEVTVRDRLTRLTAKGTVAFTVVSEVR